MEKNKLKEKFSTLDIKTGAKKATTTLALIVALTVPATVLTTTTAYASVPAANIVGDLEYQKDRSHIKEDEYQDIVDYFNGYDKKGNAYVTTDTIKKAIELSDLLNGYYFDPLYYTNTTKDEVVDLDINRIYERYTETNNIVKFCNNNLENKPAIDAYITFACGNAANNIKSAIANRVYSQLLVEGRYINEYPSVYITDTEIFAVAKVNNVLQKIEISGDAVIEIIDLYNALNDRYEKALNNIGGYSNRYDDSFAYNGVNSKDKSKNKESVWLSLPDDVKKADITKSLALVEELNIMENYTFDCEDMYYKEDLSRSEERELRDLGYSNKEVTKGIKREATLNKVINKTLVR